MLTRTPEEAERRIESVLAGLPKGKEARIPLLIFHRAYGEDSPENWAFLTKTIERLKAKYHLSHELRRDLGLIRFWLTANDENLTDSEASNPPAVGGATQ